MEPLLKNCELLLSSQHCCLQGNRSLASQVCRIGQYAVDLMSITCLLLFCPNWSILTEDEWMFIYYKCVLFLMCKRSENLQVRIPPKKASFSFVCCSIMRRKCCQLIRTSSDIIDSEEENLAKSSCSFSDRYSSVPAAYLVEIQSHICQITIEMVGLK